MRVAVVGASGNLGTAVLRALREEPAVHSVVAIARRVPRTPPPAPYDVAWHGVDLSEPPDARDDEVVVARLAQSFEGADAVVHLAWAMQPTHDRDQRRRTNVDGTRRVLSAVARAGVPHLVVASSVGAYAPVRDDEPRTEDWAVEPVPSSDYAVDKVENERLLDEVESAYPAMVVTRLRPALVFQRAAGSSIERYFLGPLLPAAVLRRRLPVLPWPSGFRVQAVHSDDLGDLVRRVLVRRAGGAFNVAGPGILRGPEVASVMAHGRSVDVPVAAVRAAVSAGWRTHGVALSPGWIDLAAGVPVLSTARAREVLDWEPRWSAVEALADLVDGMAYGSGTVSPPLRVRDRARRSPVGGQRSNR